MGQNRFPNAPVFQHSKSQVLRSPKMRETSVHKLDFIQERALGLGPKP